MQLGHLTDNLIEGRVYESVELDFTDRTVSPHGQTDRGADNSGLGQRRVDDAMVAEILLQPVGHPEDTAELADILSHDDHLVVVLQRRPQASVQGTGHSHPGHDA
ncbi:Uncharacterised protein [Mycobacteroides abscessus subsp. abscessus]|nr:Uncharacterised protein [Mycobacteroides abscessus subsp. abscessus]